MNSSDPKTAVLIATAADVLRRLMASAEAGEIEAATPQGRAMLHRIEGAAIALESLSGT